MTVTADAHDMLAGDPPRYPHIPGDFHRHPETGAPYVNHPTDTTKDGRPKRVMYGRPSSFGAALDNPFNLVKWKERQLLIGAWTLTDYGKWPIQLDPEDRDDLDGLAARCHEAAGSHLAADRGTHVHKLLEREDQGHATTNALLDEGERLGIPADLQLHIVDQWFQFRRRLGLTAVAVEQTVVNDRWRLAGTLDRLDVSDRDHLTAFGVLEAGVPFVGDIKTGGLTIGNDGQPNYWVKYPVQLAAYVDAVPYDVETDERWMWSQYITPIDRAAPPHAGIALIYHYDLARALAGEVVDWQAIPVNVQAGREGGDLCRAAADFAKRRDLFAMPAPSVPPFSAINIPDTPTSGTVGGCKSVTIAAPAGPNPVVEQRTADPEPSTASTAVPGRAADWLEHEYADGEPDEVTGITYRDRLVARIKDLIFNSHDHPGTEAMLRRHWPEGVPTLKHDGHSDAQLQLILAAVRRVEAEVGAGWHPDDGPPPYVNTDPRAEIDYPTAVAPDEGGEVEDYLVPMLQSQYDDLDIDGKALCCEVAREAQLAGRSISVSQNPTVRRWSIARAVIAWAGSGRTVDELWLAVSNLATFEQCRDPSATLGGLISQFTIEQSERLYEAAGQSL
jgi:hypothetical protein